MPTPTKRPSYRRNKTPKASFFALVFTAMVLSFGLLAGVRYVGDSRDIRQQAAQGQTVKLRLHGQTVNSGELRIDFLLNTQGYSVAGTQIAAQLSGATPSEVSIDTGNSLNLERVGSKVTSRDNGSSIEFVQFAPLDSGKPVNTNGQEQKIASVFVRKSQGGTFTLTFDRSRTSIPVVNNPSIGLDVVSSQTFTLSAGGGNNNNNNNNNNNSDKKSCNQNCATDTECRSEFVCYKGQCRSPENREDSECRGVGDQGIHRGCNEYCADKNECAAGFSCYFNRCRNPRNLNNTSCANPASPRPITQVVTVPAATPVPSPSVSPSPSPSPTATASASVTPSPSSNVYDEGRFRVSPSPTIRRASPTPAAQATSQSSAAGRFARAGLILLFALVIVIPAGIYLYRKSR